MGELHMSLKQFTHVIIIFIEKGIVQTSKNYTSLDSPAHKEYENLSI